ncbi:hypothetical protein Q0812_04105 [Brevundimonas sp. 2R-24]|uniref:Uncharacterized protein n=1 Tax=Peiella sedimenti TaxID=3061083 RepID=A0ABT8SJ54_9CAUL|nr:hypothetical protein [Caulobacteraceae bacterium XZ-24]
MADRAYHHIHLELAREPSAPGGDARLGYDVVAPLTAEGRLDVDGCRADPDRCRVRRFRDGETEDVGVLRSRRGGGWVFDFDEGEADDEAGFRLDDEQFQPGEYVSVRMTDGQMHTFRVVTVRRLEG